MKKEIPHIEQKRYVFIHFIIPIILLPANLIIDNYIFQMISYVAIIVILYSLSFDDVVGLYEKRRPYWGYSVMAITLLFLISFMISASYLIIDKEEKILISEIRWPLHIGTIIFLYANYFTKLKQVREE